MKYIITEGQQNKLIEIILQYLNNNLVPKGGWKREYYKRELETGYELFFMFDTEEEAFKARNKLLKDIEHKNVIK